MKDLRKLSIRLGSSVREAISALNRGSLQIALVMDAEQRLIGTVTDGDIRRGLLQGFNLDSPISQLMRTQFRFVQEGINEADALRMMHKEGFQQIPVLDNQGRVVRLLLLKDMIDLPSFSNSIVIMAGGEGKRLRPLTENCPKPMLKVQGKPILELIIERCRDAGFQQFYLAVNYLKQQIIEYFRNGSGLGVNIDYLEENQPLGTAGALRLMPQNPHEAFLVLNGDVLTQIPYQALLQFHEENQAHATVSVKEHQTTIPFGVVETKGTLVSGFQEKPTLTHYVNAGVYALSPNVLSYLTPNDPCDMPELLQRIQADNQSVRAFPIHENWLDVGNKDAFKIAQNL